MSLLTKPACGQAHRRLSSEAGLTLLELLIVISILGLLGVLGSIQLMGYLDRARTSTAQLQIEQLSTALDLFRLDAGRFPTEQEGLDRKSVV